jgi:NADH-quinone oxidoreductase subunit L
MIMGLGVGGFTAGLLHLTTHAAFKACLFLGSGSVIHAVHSQDIFEMGGLWKKMKITAVTFIIATLAIAGVPGFSGFYSKDMILAAALEFGMRHPQHMVIFAVTLFTAGMTAFYMFRLVILTFFGKPRDHHKYDHAHESPPNMWVPLVILAALSFAFWFKVPLAEKGWFEVLVPKPASAVVTAAAAPAHPAGEAKAEHDLHLAHKAHTIAMYSSVGVAGLGILLAFGIYMLGWVDPDKVAAKFPRLHDFLVNKWYFDELYEATAVNGTKTLSRALGWFDLHVVDGLVNLCAQMGVWASFLIGKFDNGVVDGAVNGVATVTIESGSFFRRFQTGKLYH